MLAPATSQRPARLDDLLEPALMAKLDRLDVLSRKVFAGKLPGERRSKKRGQSVEFDDYRDYVPGDDLRRIDWNVYARLDRLFIKLFREEEDLALHLVIDASPSMDAGGEHGSPTKLVFCQRLAMALGYIGLVNQNRVLASIIGVPGRGAVQQLAPMRGRRNIRRLADFLLGAVRPEAGAARSGPPEDVSFNLALKRIALSRRGRGVMVLLSDLLVREDIRIGLNYLAGAGGTGGFDTYILHVLSPGELEPETLRDAGLVGDLRLTDAETGHAAEVTVTAALIRRYKQRLNGLLDGVRTAATARGMSYALLRSDADLTVLLLDYLRRRGLLG